MATATTQHSKHESSAPASSGSWAFEFAALSILVALAYRLPAYVMSVWARPHLQFALIIPIGVVFLAFIRQEEMERSESAPIHGATLMTAFILFLAAVLGFDAFVSYSAVCWSVSALLTALAFVHFWGGWALFRRVWPMWAFGWLMVPPPFGLDLRLITQLQLWVSWLASYTLDAFHVAHVLEGNVIRLEAKDLFVAEACSGINSLFATFVVLVFSMLVLKRNWLHILLLFAMGFLCVLAVNVFRVVTLTSLHYFSPRVGDFFDTWIPHTTFGLFCFALLILLIVSVDALLWLTVDFLFTSDTYRSGKRSGDRSRSGQRPDTEPADDRPLLTRLAAARRRVRASCPPGAGWAVVGAVFALLAGVEYAAGAWRFAHRAPPTSDAGQPDPLATMLGDLTGVLPTEWDGWKREGEKTEHLNFTNAMFSSSWIYRRGGEELTVFLHRSYPEFHGMEVCYAGNGWQVKNLAGGNPSDSSIEGAPEEIQFISFEMDKQDEGSYVIAYLNFDYANGRWGEVPPIYRGLSLSDRVWLAVRARQEGLRNLFARSEQVTELAVVLVQRRTTRGAEVGDRKEAIERLVAASRRVFASILATPDKAASAGLSQQP